MRVYKAECTPSFDEVRISFDNFGKKLAFFTSVLKSAGITLFLSSYNFQNTTSGILGYISLRERLELIY